MDNTKNFILEAYNFRYACKKFDPSKKISDDDFNFILECGRLSPSSLGFEPWKFLVVQNEELRKELQPLCPGAMNQIPTASHFVIILARTSDDMRYDSEYIRYIQKSIKHMSDEYIEKMDGFIKNFQQKLFDIAGSDKGLFDWSCKQTYIPFANMMTAAAMINVDSCPIEGFDSEKVNKLLESKGLIDMKHFAVSCMAAFGYRGEENPYPKTRRDMKEVVEYIR